MAVSNGKVILLLVIVAILSYDIGKHGALSSSNTGRFMKDIGALQYGKDIWEKTKSYSYIPAYAEEKTHAVFEWIDHHAPWLLDNVKTRSAKICEVVKQNSLIQWQSFLHHFYLGLEWAKTDVFVVTCLQRIFRSTQRKH
jgi:hypothetical protein